MFPKMHISHISFIIVLMLLPHVWCIEVLKPVKPLNLSRSELRSRYGQENTVYNDTRSCYRECNGIKKICYYEFKIENFNAMGSACGDCARGKIEDCFNENCITVNGVERNIMTVNRKIPGPRINVCLGDEVVVDLTNRMSGSNSAIHWHGIHQKETPWSDGVPMVTQCPIHDSNSFRYDFYASQVGTHYWHCHSGIHRFNGCFGKLVVRDTLGKDPHEALYDYDLEQHQVMITDWSNYLGEDFLPSKRSQPLKVDSILINGHGTYFNPIDKTRTFAPIAAFHAEPNKRYRWRVDNAASQNCPLEFCIEDHKLKMIAADGASVNPIVVDCFVSGSGERYDFVLDTSNSEKSEYLIRVRALGFCAADGVQEIARLLIANNINNNTTSPYVDHQPVLDIPPYDEPYTNSITLNHPDTKCGYSSSFCVPDLVPITNSKFEDLRNIDEVERVERILINFQLNVGNTMPSHFLAFNSVTITGSVNNIVTTTPPVPPLTQDDPFTQFCNAGQLPSGCNATTLCSCPHLIELKLNKVYDFIFLDGDEPGPTIHPFHFHGYLMQVLETGSKDEYENGNPAYRKLTRKAPLKDTIAVPSGGYAIARFRATNPGFWLMHCHIEYHMHIGMRLIVKVGKKRDMVPPPDNFPVCGNFPA